MKDTLPIPVIHKLVLTTAFLWLLQIPSGAQVSHIIDVVSNSFIPDELTIQAGDTVIWTNTQGTHNVNGTQDTYPSNPESFGNEVGTGWTYTFVFSMSGTYDYQCDPHVNYGMIGKIIVEDAVPTSNLLMVNSEKESLRIFPNPARDFIRVEAEGSIESVSVFSITGMLIKSDSRQNKGSLLIDLGDTVPGIYLVSVRLSGEGSESIHRIVKK